MKKSKSALSVILCAVMLLSCCVLSSRADSVELYPESEHNYRDNYYNEWNYTYPTQAEGLFVTFSNETRTEAADFYDIRFEDEANISLSDVMDYAGNYKTGDYISIFDSDNNLVGVYQGYDLSNRTLYIPGSSFKITLTSDSCITDYGFSIEEITTEIPQYTYLLRLHLNNGKTATEYFTYDDYMWDIWSYSNFYKYNGLIIEGEAIIGFETDDEKCYFELPNSYKLGEPGIYDFDAITTPVILQPEDVYSFNNGNNYFDVDDKNHYYMTKENYLRLISSSCVVNGVGPLALPACVTSAVLVTYADWPWMGSCIGFTSTVCQQKAGVLDVVGTQPDAKCMRDLEPTPELISLLNYYNGQSFTSALAKNKALKKFPEEYSRQLKSMYECAEQGNLVLLEFFTGPEISTGYHGLAVSGAYTDDVGNHVLLCYDSNFSQYATEGVCRKCYISPDFTSLDTGYGEGLGFVWTDDFQCYKSLDASKVTSPVDYKIGLWSHYIDIILKWFQYYIIDALFK